MKFVSLLWFLRLYHFYSLFTAYFLCEEVMSVRLYAKGNDVKKFLKNLLGLLLLAILF